MKHRIIGCFLTLCLLFTMGGMASATLWQVAKGEPLAGLYEPPPPPPPPPPPTLDWTEEASLITKDIEEVMGDKAKNFSLYACRPDTDGEPFIYNSQSLPPASMIKLFVMAKVMQDARDGKLLLSEQLTIRYKDVVSGSGVITWYESDTKWTIGDLVKVMIAESDNTATNILIDRVGMKAINNYLAKVGYKDTVLGHKMMLASRGKKNTSSVADVGKLLTRLYKRELVGPVEDEFMLYVLSRQKDKECFPAALPDWVIAHKTGEVEGLFDDGGIFYGERGNFILVIMNENIDRMDTIEAMKEIARRMAERTTA